MKLRSCALPCIAAFWIRWTGGNGKNWKNADANLIVLPSSPTKPIALTIGKLAADLDTAQQRTRRDGPSPCSAQWMPDSPHAVLLRNCLRQIADQIGMDFMCNADSGEITDHSACHGLTA